MKYRKKKVVIEAVIFTDEAACMENLEKLGLDPVQVSYEDPSNPKLLIHTLKGEMQGSIGDYIIRGVKGEFYPCKPDIFKETYEAEDQPSSNMTFGQAIEAAKKGHKIARLGWNGKNQYVELATCISYMTSDRLILNVEHEAIGNAAFAFCGTSGVQMGWLASQADMLAEDWRLVE